MLVAGAAIFFALLWLGVPTDIQLHLAMIDDFVDGTRPIPPNLLFYATVYALTFFSQSETWLFLATAMVLGTAILAKFRISRSYLDTQLAPPAATEVSRGWIFAMSVSMLVVLSLPTTTAYIGQITPNVWHNSTVIFVFPFALALFLLSARYLEDPSVRGLLLKLALLSGINILAKPSFFFVFAVAFPLMALVRFRLTAPFWKSLVPVTVGGVGVLVSYLVLYESEAATEAGASVVLRPFTVWSIFSDSIPLSLLASTLFPLVATIVLRRILFRNLHYQYAVVCYGIGATMMAVLSETGERQFHGNFFWQAYIAAYILFLVCLAATAKQAVLRRFKDHWVNAALIVFALHTVYGAAYLARLLIVGKW